MALRALCWMKPARKAFEGFPVEVQDRVLDALISVALGAKPDLAKPLQGIEGGVFEIAIRHRKDAWRVVYAVKIRSEIWIVHAFQKKSKSGIATPHNEIETIRHRLKQLKTSDT